jgi:hypothetical protein
MKTEISRAILNQKTQLGVTGRRIHEAIEQPDSREFIEIDNVKVAIWQKAFRRGTPAFQVLVVTRDEQERRIVDFAFRVFPDLVAAGFEELTPLGVLRAVAERFGRETCVAGVTSKFHAGRKVELNPGEDANVVGLPRSGDFTTCVIMKPEGRTLKCALVFCLDQTAYGSWLSSHNSAG